MQRQLKNVVKKLQIVLVSFVLVLISQVVYSQDPGGGPDGPPPAVPFDDYLLLILVFIGVVFTYILFKRKQIKIVSH